MLDILFDLLYESDVLNLADIHTNRSNDGFQIIGNDESSFEIVCYRLENNGEKKNPIIRSSSFGADGGT